MLAECNSILVVDDNESDRLLAKFAIEDSGLTEHVYFSCDGKEALDFIENYEKNKALHDKGYPPTLILLDINMPAMNGFEFLESYDKFNNDERYNSVVILMLTSSHSEDDMQKAGQFKSVKGFLTKPVDEDNLLKAFNEALSKQ
jgi:CheY-like chemotaxis protein